MYQDQNNADSNNQFGSQQSIKNTQLISGKDDLQFLANQEMNLKMNPSLAKDLIVEGGVINLESENLTYT